MLRRFDKKIMKTIVFITSLLTTGLLWSQNATALIAKQIVEKEIVTQDEKGQNIIKRVAPTAITPGDRVIYRLVYTNNLSEPSDDFVLTMPVPQQLTLIVGSEIFAGIKTRYSTDNGKSFNLRENVRVKTEDGLSRPAGVKDITHIRWEMTEAVPAGASGELSFSAIIN